MRRMALWLGLAFCLGLGIGYSLRELTSTGSSREQSKVVHDIPGRPPEQLQQKPVEQEQPAERSDPPGVSASLVTAIARTTARITGRVTTEEGEPVAGVRVAAYIDVQQGSSRHAGRSKLEDDPRTATSRRQHREATQRSTSTDRDGSFALTNLADELHRLDAQLAGYEILPRMKDKVAIPPR